MTFFCPYKNSYLQLTVGGIEPRLINRAVNEAMDWETDCFDKPKPFFRLTSNQPTLPTQKCDYLCREQAFGRWAIPKLRRELHSACPEIVSSAINTLMDIVKDPEKTYEVIKLKVPDRLADLMLHKDKTVRERIILILTTIASQEPGREAICENELIIKNILELLEDPTIQIRYKNAILIRRLTDSWEAVGTLINYDFIDSLHSIFMKEECHILVELLAAFNHLIIGEGKNIAYSIGAFQTMIDLIYVHTNEFVLEEILNCISILLTLKAAKKFSVKKKLLKHSTQFLFHYKPTVYTAAAQAVMNATHRTKAKKQALEIDGLLDQLLAIASDSTNPRGQIFCLQTLINLAEHPVHRKYLYEEQLEQIKKISFDKRELMPHLQLDKQKQRLLNVIKWKPACPPTQ